MNDGTGRRAASSPLAISTRDADAARSTDSHGRGVIKVAEVLAGNSPTYICGTCLANVVGGERRALTPSRYVTRFQADATSRRFYPAPGIILFGSRITSLLWLVSKPRPAFLSRDEPPDRTIIPPFPPFTLCFPCFARYPRFAVLRSR